MSRNVTNGIILLTVLAFGRFLRRSRLIAVFLMLWQIIYRELFPTVSTNSSLYACILMTFYLVFGEFDFTISAVSRFVTNRLMLFQVFQRVLVSAESARSSPTISAVLRCVRSHDSLFAYRAVIVGVVLGWRLSLRRLICWRLEWFHSYIDHIAW